MEIIMVYYSNLYLMMLIKVSRSYTFDIVDLHAGLCVHGFVFVMGYMCISGFCKCVSSTCESNMTACLQIG